MKNQGLNFCRHDRNLSQVMSLAKVTTPDEAMTATGMSMESPKVATVKR